MMCKCIYTYLYIHTYILTMTITQLLALPWGVLGAILCRLQFSFLPRSTASLKNARSSNKILVDFGGYVGKGIKNTSGNTYRQSPFKLSRNIFLLFSEKSLPSKQGHPGHFWHLRSQQSLSALSEERPLRGLSKREDSHQYRSLRIHCITVCPGMPEHTTKIQEMPWVAKAGKCNKHFLGEKCHSGSWKKTQYNGTLTSLSHSIGK